MRLCSLIFACALLCENFVNDGHCFDLAQKDQTLACSGKTHLVASSHPTAKEFCIYASVDPASDTSSPLQRQALYSQGQERDRSHDSAAEKLRLALPVVQGHEWEACIMLPPLWRQMVRSWGGHRRWQPSLRSVASEPTKAAGSWGQPSETEVAPTQRQGTWWLHPQSKTEAESASQGQEDSRHIGPCRCPTSETSCASRGWQWIDFLVGTIADATSSKPSSPSLAGSLQCSTIYCTAPAVRCNETAAHIAQEGPGEVIAGKPRIGQDSDRQGGEKRRERIADCCKGHGKSSQRPAGGLRSKVQPSSQVEDVSVHECRAMAGLYDRISTAGISGQSHYPSSQGLAGLGQAESRDLQGSVPIPTRCSPSLGGPRCHVRRGNSGRSGSSKAARGLAEFDNVPPRSSQGCRRCDCSRECLEESKAQRRNRCVGASRWQSFAAFWCARYFATLECEYQGRAPICPDVFQMKWTHSILSEPDFRTEWHARAAAVRLSFECDTISESFTSRKPWTQSDKHPHYRVHFDDSFSLLCSDPEAGICSIFHGKHGDVQTFIKQFQNTTLLDDDPLSNSSAVSISQRDDIPQDECNLMQLATHMASGIVTANEPGVPVWYPLPDRGMLPADDHDMDQASDDSDGDRSDEDPGRDEDPVDPDSPDDLIHPPSESSDRQSALMYHLDDQPIHAMLFWTDFERLMSEIARHYQIHREALFDSYELNMRPKDIPPGTAPLLVHFVNDFPHGANLVLALVDIELHGNECETHFQTFPDLQRRVIPVPGRLTRDVLLRLAKVLDYCKVEHERCLVEVNAVPWNVQNRLPIDMQHGDYIRILIPPPTDCRVGTQEMLNDSHHLTVEDFWGRYYVPSSPEDASGSDHSSVSPSLIDSEAIKREFGPHSDTDQDDHSQMQLPNAPAAASSDNNVNLAQQVEQIVNSSCLLAFNIEETWSWPFWYRGLFTTFGQHAIVENDNEGPVCYYDTWYADCREESVTEVSRPLRLDSMHNLWQHDIQHLWRDKIQEGIPIHVVWVMPAPPPQPMSRSAGHLIIYQFPNERLVPFLTTIQFVALEDHGTTIACVVGDPSATPVAIVQRLNLDRVCRGRLCTLHRGAISGGIRHTWTMPIVIGENLRLVIPPFGARAHIDILSYPNCVEIVQTGPIPDAFDISMRLEDHSEFTRELHEYWTQFSRRGPAGLEMLLEINTWYLDAQFVPFNEQSRPVILGEDFFQWEQQIREKWADLADASADITFVFVRPTPRGWPIDHIHVLALQQFEPGSTDIGGLVTIYDEALGRGAPSTIATVLPRDLNRQRLVDASGRQVWPGHSCSAWFEGFEIRDSTVFQASHGQSFLVQISRPQLQSWDQPLPAEDTNALLQLRVESVLPAVTSNEVRPVAKVQATTAIRLIPAFSFDSADVTLPSFIEIEEDFGSQEVEHELLSFGLQVIAFVIDQKSAALCCPLVPVTQEPVGRIVSVNLSPQAIQRYQVHYFQQGCKCDDIQLMQILQAAGFAKAVILQQFWHQHDVAEIHFTIPEGTLAVPVGPVRVQKPWPARQPIVPAAPMFQLHNEEVAQCALELGVSAADIQNFFTKVHWPLCDITHDLDLPECSAVACQSLDRLEHYDRLVIYTDGSSHSGRLHRSTAFIDATIHPRLMGISGFGGKVWTG